MTTYRRYDTSFENIYADLSVADIKELAPYFELETNEIVESNVTPSPSPAPSRTPVPAP